MAIVPVAGGSGYFRDYADRCLVYLISAHRAAAVFVETARGRFVLTAGASGQFTAPNANVQRGRRLHLR
jgi:hypothetical protein